MEPDDPFGWINELCRRSSSEDNRVGCPSYFGQPDSDDSDSQKALDIPVTSTGITMVSLPGSPEDEVPGDTDTPPEDDEIFHTPPESRSTSTSIDNCHDDQMVGADPYNNGDTVSVQADSGDSRKAVDFGRDASLGFSEVEVGVDSTQRIEVDSTPNDALRRKTEEIRDSERGFSPRGQSSIEPPSKKLKSLDFDLPIVRLGTPEEENSEEILKSLEKWKLEMDSLSPGASSEFELENQQNHEYKVEVGEGSVRNRSLEFSTEVVDSEDGERHTECENNNGEGSDEEKSLDLWAKDTECDLEERIRLSEMGKDNDERNSGKNKKTIEDTDQFRCSGENGSNSREMEVKIERKRQLPSWATGRCSGENGSNSREMEVKIERKRQLPSWDTGRCSGENGSNSREMEVKIERNRRFPSWATGRVGTEANGRVKINARESVQINMDSDNVSKDSSTLPETGEKIERKRALPSWAIGSLEADRRVEVNERESERVEVNEMEPGRVEVNEKGSAQANTVSDSLREDLDDVMLLNVLTELKEEQNYEEDRELVCMNLWEVAKRNGIEDIDSSAE